MNVCFWGFIFPRLLIVSSNSIPQSTGCFVPRSGVFKFHDNNVHSAIMQQLQIGDKYQGGIIFYLDESASHGLISSSKDLSGEADWDEAMECCLQYMSEGFTDWRLPTEEELHLLYLQKEIVGGFVRFSYWSATEYAGHFAFFQNFHTGERDNDFKDNTCYVRAIRNF